MVAFVQSLPDVQILGLVDKSLAFVRRKGILIFMNNLSNNWLLRRWREVISVVRKLSLWMKLMILNNCWGSFITINETRVRICLFLLAWSIILGCYEILIGLIANDKRIIIKRNFSFLWSKPLSFYILSLFLMISIIIFLSYVWRVWIRWIGRCNRYIWVG